jgi:hypothetical protein
VLAFVTLSASGRIDLYDDSPGRVQVLVDVTGYLSAGAATAAQTFTPLAPARVLDTARGAVAAGGGLGAQLGGRGGVPRAHVSAVLATITVVAGRRSGQITAWRAGRARPRADTLQFAAGQTVTGAALIPVSSSGRADLHNSSRAAVRLVVDVRGYVSSSVLTTPSVSVSRYVRTVGGAFTDAGPDGDGCLDAQAGSSLVLLDIGAQLNSKNGVALSAVDTRVSYANLDTAIEAYLADFASCASGSSATIAIGTNNDGDDWTHYTSRQRGRDWADKVVDEVSAHRPAGGEHLVIAGADDIESGFFSTEPQARTWELAYLAATSHELIYAGSADGCPTAFGETRRGCAFGWTQRQNYALAHDPSRIRVLPQVYTAAQAVQWAGIDAAGGGRLVFAGALTEHAAAPSRSVAPVPGWVALTRAVSSVVVAPRVPAATDLRVAS